MNESNVRAVKRSESENIVAILTRAFMDDPIVSWVLPDRAKREKSLPKYFRMAMRMGHAQGRVNTDAEGRSGAIWMPPDNSVPGTMSMLRNGLIPLALSLGLSGNRQFMAFSNLTEPMHKKDVQRNHWYLWVLGVDPPNQGQGVGSGVIQPELREADLAGLPCYLETAKEIDVTFYNKHGFEVLKEVRIPRDGPKVWTMLRQPIG